MTRNLTIATLFLLASTLLLGYIWVREHYVLDDRASRFQGALLARGAADYEQYCSNCHGMIGEGGVSAGAPQINNLPTTMAQQNRLDGPTGITAKYGTVRNYVEAVVTAGIKGTAMPRWSARLGGPLRDDQIENIAAYVQTWWAAEGNPNPNVTGDAMQLAAAYKQSVQATALASQPQDDPVSRGAALFSANGCNGCHNLNDQDSGVPAPGLGGLFSPEGTAAWGTLLPSGEEISVESLKAWIVGGSAGFPNERPPLNPGHGPYQPIMPGYPQLTDEQLNDLVAYLSTLDRAGQSSLPPLGPDGQPLPAEAVQTPGADAPSSDQTAPPPGGEVQQQPTPSGQNVQPNTAPESSTTAPAATSGSSAGPTTTP